MSRHREIAASPARTAAETWDAICRVVAATLARSTNIDQADVVATLSSLTPAGLALVAGGHLDRSPLTLVADPLRLTVATVSGERALTVVDNENPNPVPGAATCTDWTLYLPTPAGLKSLINEAAASVPHTTAGKPPAAAAAADSATKTGTTIDLNRLDPRARKIP